MDTENQTQKVVLAILVSIFAYFVGVEKNQDPIDSKQEQGIVVTDDNQEDNVTTIKPAQSNIVTVDGHEYSTGWIPPTR